MANFYGRERELRILHEQFDYDIARLIVIRGRRRIGKSRLTEVFGESFVKHYTFVGLPPDEDVTADMERQHFANDLERQTGLQGIRSDDWDFLFHNLAQFTAQGQVLVVLDEINWMGIKDPTFLGKLKTAWDTHFKKNPQLVMILSGSMASWIEQNILNSTGFFGRVDLDMVLHELPLNICNHFWNPFADSVSAHEKFKMLCVTGGVPRYLESINPKLSTEENARRLFFRKEGLLFKEYQRIFTDVFKSRAPIYQKIVECLAQHSMEQKGILKALNLPKSGVYSEYLQELVETGYIARDFTWSIKTGKISKLSKYRLSDNYLRFYLKYIGPSKEAILHDRAEVPNNWHSIMGLQFENLVLANRKSLYRLLKIDPKEIKVDNPYFARQTKKRQGVQVDYMIQTKFNTLYVFEIKLHTEKINASVIDEVKEKVKRLKLPRGFSVRPVLIHVNGVTDGLLEQQYFSHIIDFGELLIE